MKGDNKMGSVSCLLEREHSSKEKVMETLGESERLWDNHFCPDCGGYLTENLGAGHCLAQCIDCNYSIYDYD